MVKVIYTPSFVKLDYPENKPLFTRKVLSDYKRMGEFSSSFVSFLEGEEEKKKLLKEIKKKIFKL